MYLRKRNGPLSVVTDGGNVMTRSELPPASTKRWVASRKSQVVRAIRNGLITEEEAIRTWQLSPDEIQEWDQMFDRYGRKGLRATFRPEDRQL